MTDPTDEPFGETILLVEDERSVRFVLGESLRRKGYQVMEARNGAEALEILAGGASIDLMITDVVMPEVGGFELVSRVALEHPSVKVLLMSGYTEGDGDVGGNRTLEPGTHFLRKPFSTLQLAQKVREVIEE